MAATKDRNTPEREGKTYNYGVGATEKIYAGTLVVHDGDGYAASATKTTGLTPLGRAQTQVDNSAGADGDLTIDVEKGCFLWDNDGDVSIGDVGGNAYAVDDVTVTAVSTGASVVGVIKVVDSDGVWVFTE